MEMQISDYNIAIVKAHCAMTDRMRTPILMKITTSFRNAKYFGYITGSINTVSVTVS